jgi:hypothetical protein
MKLVTFRNFFMVGGLALLVLTGASYDARAQGRGRGESNEDKKCSKFVNCHDASEGRWDGRGPRRGTDSDNWNSRHFRHDRDSNRFTDQRRRHHRDREFNRNDYWRHHNRDMGRQRTWSRRGR